MPACHAADLGSIPSQGVFLKGSSLKEERPASNREVAGSNPVCPVFEISSNQMCLNHALF